MQNEIELKIMMAADNIAGVENWLDKQGVQYCQTIQLANTYFDTDEQFFAQHQMGLRVRTFNHKHEMTLKMKGDIIGGLHIRPEYNLDLPNNIPDFNRLVAHFNLPFENAQDISENLITTFSTDFSRKIWLLNFQKSEIEIALDRGIIKNPYGEEEICELEFELKRGNTTDLFEFLEIFPLKDGMWLSSLSKAQRGYLLGREDKVEKELAELAEYSYDGLSETEIYRLSQQVADFIRLKPEDPRLLMLWSQLGNRMQADLSAWLISEDYLRQNLMFLKRL